MPVCYTPPIAVVQLAESSPQHFNTFHKQVEMLLHPQESSWHRDETLDLVAAQNAVQRLWFSQAIRNPDLDFHQRQRCLIGLLTELPPVFSFQGESEQELAIRAASVWAPILKSLPATHASFHLVRMGSLALCSALVFEIAGELGHQIPSVLPNRRQLNLRVTAHNGVQFGRVELVGDTPTMLDKTLPRVTDEINLAGLAPGTYRLRFWTYQEGQGRKAFWGPVLKIRPFAPIPESLT